MTERGFRMVIGAWLLLALLMAQPLATYILMGILLFEGATNWRIPIILARFSPQPEAVSASGSPSVKEAAIPFEAERALRLIIVAFLAASMSLVPEMLWWVPWFIAFALIGAGISGICPMVLALRWLGMR